MRTRRLRGEESRRDSNADAAELETIGVPTGADRGIGGRLALVVSPESVVEQRQTLSPEGVSIPVEFARECRRAHTVVRVAPIVDTERVVQQSEKENDERVRSCLRREIEACRGDAIGVPPAVECGEPDVRV